MVLTNPPFGKRASFTVINEEGQSETQTLTYERDKTNLDIFWLKDDSLEDTENLPEPDVLASDIVENLGAALEQFRGIQEELEETAAEAEQEATEAV